MSIYSPIIGPIALALAALLAAKIPCSPDLLCAALCGLFLSACWQMKGCYYALVLLVAIGIGAHAFVETHHFLRLGFEASFACSFFITALAVELNANERTNLQSQCDAKGASLSNLEEEIRK